MFTGIVRDIGRVTAVTNIDSGLHLRVETALPISALEIGASVSCGGACMTVVGSGHGDARSQWFEFDASSETLDCTTISNWAPGTKINLEPSLKLGDEMGGHVVTGHVDATAQLTKLEKEGDMQRMSFALPAHLSKFVAAKGSVALDGTSLTVNSVEADEMSLMLIPHTLQVTT